MSYRRVVRKLADSDVGRRIGHAGRQNAGGSLVSAMPDAARQHGWISTVSSSISTENSTADERNDNEYQAINETFSELRRRQCPQTAGSREFWRSHAALSKGPAFKVDYSHAPVRWMSSSSSVVKEKSSSSASPTAAITHDQSTGKEQKSKNVEASAADCDVAVEGLTSVKARVKAANEAVRKGEGVLKASYLLVVAILMKTWQAFLGIGPAVKKVAGMSRKDWANTISGWNKTIKNVLQHYWIGLKLLWADVRISSRLLGKLAGGKQLTRRERQQLTRTAADIFRLVPFAVFIIIPLAEFALPLFLRFFPNMLPSTFQDKMQEEEKLKKRLKARLEMAKFLQETVGEMAKEVKSSRSGDAKKRAEELTKFMTKVRTGGKVANTEIIKFASLFNDELTLDNISRPRLVSMCKYMGLQTFGTDAYLRYILRAKLAWIKEDDKMIQSEGVESLSEPELRAACRERGMLGLQSVDGMRQQVRDWLDLSLNRSVPSSLLILSRAFLVSKAKPEEVLQSTLSSLPDQVVDSVGAAVPPGEEEDSVAERKRKLEYLKQEEKLIQEEEAQELARRKEEEQEGSRDVALEEMQASTRAEKRQDLAKAKAVERSDDLCKLSGALAVLAAGSSVAKERADFLRLVNAEIKMYNSMVEKQGTEGEEQAKQAYRAAREEAVEAASGDEVSTALISRVDSMLHKLELELDDVDAKIGAKWKVLDMDHDGKVTPEEVAAAAAFLRDSLDNVSVQELISNLAKDPEGKILVEDIVRLGVTEDPADDVHKREHPEEQKALPSK